MPDIAALAKALADAGGWAALLVVAGGFLTAFVRGLVVARSLYDLQVTRGDRLETQLGRMTEAFETLTDEIRTDRLLASRGGRRA